MKAEEALLLGLSSALKEERYSLSLNSEETLRFFRLAEEHKILPLLTDALEDPSLYPAFLRRARRETYTQAQRSADFLLLYEYLREKGLSPLVVKGMICRSLYPESEQRPSADEDLFILEKEFPKIHEALLSYGLSLVDPEQDLSDFEVAYEEKKSHLYIEVHKSLFPPSSVYSYLNDFFQEAKERKITENIYHSDLLTLSYNDHLLYLILHAYKHFLHSGFGIRQVSDILLYSRKYRTSIDWDHLKEELKKARAYELSRAIYKIGLSLYEDEELSLTLKDWDLSSVEERPLLEDILDSGIYGASSYTRLHTSTLTLNALKKKGSSSLFSTLFPSLSNMEGRFPYLKKRPYLLPLAWGKRILTYLRETKTTSNNDPRESIELAKERVKLLKKYGIVDDRD